MIRCDQDFRERKMNLSDRAINCLACLDPIQEYAICDVNEYSKDKRDVKHKILKKNCQNYDKINKQVEYVRIIFHGIVLA